jgi:hypothetical protein
MKSDWRNIEVVPDLSKPAKTSRARTCALNSGVHGNTMDLSGMRQILALLRRQSPRVVRDIAAQIASWRRLLLPSRLRASHRFLAPATQVSLLRAAAGRETIHRHLSERRAGNRPHHHAAKHQ